MRRWPRTRTTLRGGKNRNRPNLNSSDGWERAMSLHRQAVALNARNSNTVPDVGGTAPCAPLAVADAYPAAVIVDCNDDRHHLSDEPSCPVVQKRVRAVRRAVGVESAADQHREHGIEHEQGKLRRGAEAEQDREQSGRNRRGADEDQEEAGGDNFHDQQQDAADQPQPAGIDVHSGHDLLSGTPAFGLTGARATICPPIASLASSPMPPRVPMSCVASTGKRIVLALGERANWATASTYFWAMK